MQKKTLRQTKKTAILQSPPIRANPRKKRMPKETASTRNAIPELATEVFM